MWTWPKCSKGSTCAATWGASDTLRGQSSILSPSQWSGCPMTWNWFFCTELKPVHKVIWENNLSSTQLGKPRDWTYTGTFVINNHHEYRVFVMCGKLSALNRLRLSVFFLGRRERRWPSPCTTWPRALPRARLQGKEKWCNKIILFYLKSSHCRSLTKGFSAAIPLLLALWHAFPRHRWHN